MPPPTMTERADQIHGLPCVPAGQPFRSLSSYLENKPEDSEARIKSADGNRPAQRMGAAQHIDKLSGGCRLGDFRRGQGEIINTGSNLRLMEQLAIFLRISHIQPPPYNTDVMSAFMRKASRRAAPA